MPQTVLIAEDDRALAASLRRAVEGAGYACLIAADGLTALERARDSRPDLILLDLLLPKRDGRGVLAELQRGEDTRAIPVIGMSGVFRGPAHRRELQDAGAQGFLEKPFAAKDLVAHLHAVIGPPAADPARGDRVSLAEVAVAEVMWRAMQSGFTGAVQFQRGKLHKVVVMERGLPRQIRSNAAQECLGRRLLRAGRIDRAALDESVKRTKADGVRQGEVLVELGVMTPAEIEAELGAQARDKLIELFAWESGEAWQQDGVTSISYASELEGWSPHAVMLVGAARMPAAPVLRALQPHADAQPLFEEGRLTAEEARLPGVGEALAALESGASVGDLIERHGRTLYALHLVGALRFGDKVAAPPAELEAPPEPGVADPPRSEAHRELLALRDQLAARNHFERLEVEPSATSKEVRAAFLAQAKRYHPDRFNGDPEEVRAAATEIFALLSASQDALTDPEQRREYKRTLETGVDEQEGRREVERILTAEQHFRRGEADFKRRAYAAALESFEQAAELAPSEGEFQAYRAWTRYLAHSGLPESAAAAREELRQAIALAATSPTGYYFLGQLEKACQRPDQAQRMFRKVIELRPNHVDAARELRLFEMRKGGARSSGGLFGFGRKKR